MSQARDRARRDGFEELMKMMNKSDVEASKKKAAQKPAEPKAETKSKAPVEKKEKPATKTPRVTEDMKKVVQGFFHADAERRKRDRDAPSTSISEHFVGKRKSLSKPKAAEPIKVAKKRKKRA